MPFTEETIDSWNEFVALANRLGPEWIFRGGLHGWELETTLEHACHAFQIPPAMIPEAERHLVTDFQRHPQARPLGLNRTDYLEWFAAMQHYGAPSRLLDWTSSSFVAAYFAFDALFSHRQALKRSDPAKAAVWALNTAWLRHALEQVLPAADWELYRQEQDSSAFERLYINRRPPLLFVGTAVPFSLNERLSVQQSVLLCPGDVSRPWAENLAALRPGDSPDITRLLVIDRRILPDAFAGLWKMNVSARSLFPGLDGYAQSMNHRLKMLLASDAKEHG